MACTSTFRIFFSTGRWATWAMAPPPMIPILRRSPVAPPRLAVIVPPSSVPALDAGAGKVRRKNLLVALACSRPSDSTPLTKADPVARPHAVHHESGHPIALHRGDQI